MRLKGRQLRFVLASTGGWAAGRSLWLWSGGGLVVGLGTVAGVVLLNLPPFPHPVEPPVFAPVRPLRQTVPPLLSAPVSRARADAAAEPVWSSPRRASQLLHFALASYYGEPSHAWLRRATFAQPAMPPAAREPLAVPAAPGPAPASRWSGSFYAFVRPGSGRASLAAGGQLGGSQVAARLAYRLRHNLAAAARVYAPLGQKGAEAAAGLDWQIVPGALRLSVERRAGLDRAGRDAWSAYAAGGVYREPLPGLVVDMYAQAGMVGARRRDLFVDGALRASRRLPVGQGALFVGAGLWAAAQPGVSRLDAGPRLGLTLPVAGKVVGLALEGRFRLAGRARPGSGAALTLGVDF